MAKTKQVREIKKRDGRVVPFEPEKVATAIFKAAQAVGGRNRTLARQLAAKVVILLNEKFDGHTIPSVEQIQDLVEKVLMEEGHAKTAKAYILYRDQHARLRDLRKFIDSDELMEGYLSQVDWRVRENSNMTFSLQGLNNHVASSVSSHYWLHKIYPPEVRDAHLNRDFHIHDLQLLSAYCTGWDLRDLLMRGFGGVSGKVESRPPKHLRTALGQIVNFFYTVQGEIAGAVAFSNFDTYLAPFIRYDDLSYGDVKQCLQEFLFNMNVPTRVGFQCLSEDTEILTSEGWRGYSEVKAGDVIKTFNLKNSQLEEKKVTSVFKRQYQGVMYNLKNRIQDQLISPGHRVVRKLFSNGGYVLEPIEAILKLKSPFIIPVAGKNANLDAKVSDNQIKLLAWVISEGSIERPGKRRCCYRVSIYQSKLQNRANYNEIINLLKHFKLHYSEYLTASLGGEVQRMRMDAESSRVIHKWFGTKENIHFIPACLQDLSERQARLFLDTYLKADGFEGCKIATTDLDLLDQLQIMLVQAGYGFTVMTRKPTIGQKDVYVLRMIKHPETYIARVKKVNYHGVIWSVHTENETVIARRKGKVFVTGNTPFTNITLDLTVPSNIKNEPVVIGGKLQDETYGRFQKEMDLFNRAFGETMLEGDAKGRVFSFPIPTINITRDFQWGKREWNPLWEMTAKYGVPYFANFVNSDMSPDDARSMCPLAGDEKVLIKSSRGRNLEYSEIRNIYEGNSHQEKYEIYADGKFVKGKFNKFTDQKMLAIILENGHQVKMSVEHLNFAMASRKDTETVLPAKALKCGMYLPYSLKAYQGEGGNKDLGYFVGAFAGDGSFDRDETVVFSLEKKFKAKVIEKLTDIAKHYFGAHTSIVEDKKSQLVTLKVHSAAAVGLCRDFVEDKARGKHYRARLFGTNLEFRKGVLAGHYDTDGGNRNRIYTSSWKMVETLNMLAATLGTTNSVYKDERLGRLGSEPNFAVLVYKLNRKNYGNFWFKKDGRLWMRIKQVKEITNNTAYCFEVENDKPLFTIGTTGILTHNCRLRLDNRELRKRGGGLFGANPLTGSIGVVTINMPRLGYLAKDKEDFFKRLGKIMEVARKSLQVKREALEQFTEGGLYPYCRHYLDKIKESFGEYWRNHFNTIGLLGMNEACLNLLKTSLSTNKGHKFAKETLVFMRERMMDYQNEENQLYNLEATPAEGTSYNFAKYDKEKYPKIIVANEKTYQAGAKPYYTNSTHLPVNFTDDFFEALDRQDDLQSLYTGGCIEKGNKVLTSKGLLPIEYIVENFEQLKPIKALSYNAEEGISEWDEIREAVAINVNKHNKIQILGERNLNIITSDWHPFFLLKRFKPNHACPVCREKMKNSRAFAAHVRWNLKCRTKYQVMPKYGVVEKRADELKRGDYILQNSYNLYPDSKTELNNDLMWLLGFFIGDGCISRFIDDRGGNQLKKYKIRFFSEHQAALEKVAKILYRYFGCKVEVIQNDKRSKALREISSSKEKVLMFFFGYGFREGEKVYKIFVPQKVKENFTKTNVFSFLAGLMDSDGYISKRDGDFEYYTVSAKLADDILEICSRAGIMISKTKKRTHRENEVDIWRLRIPAYSITAMRGYLTNTVHTLRMKRNVSNRKKRHLPVVRVREVSKVGVRDNQFYDLMTPKNHNYLAGKDCLVFVHNTVLHGFIGERLPNITAVKSLIKKVCHRYHLPYFTLTPTFSICPKHGYIAGEHEYCPKCDAEIGYTVKNKK